MKIRILALLAFLGLVGSLGPLGSNPSPDQALEQARVEAMREATQAFLATLDDGQRALVSRSLDDNAARTNWSNLPYSMAPRTGLSVKDMSSVQRRAFHAMLASALSSQGYLKSATIMWHEDVLREMFEGSVAEMADDHPNKARDQAFAENYDTETFFLHIFGDPADEDWAWMATGHHLGVNFSVSHNRIAFTPLFLGANPQVVPEGRHAGWRLLEHEAERALALMRSFSPAQLDEAWISESVDGERFAGPGKADFTASLTGIEASRLSPVQRRMLEGLIEEYLSNASDEAAARQRAAIKAEGWGKVRFSWWGPIDQPRGRYMYRVQGPRVLIDYVREPSRGGGFNHVHSIMRDPVHDYGADWLERHYEEDH